MKTYHDGYRAGLQAAEKICDALADGHDGGALCKVIIECALLDDAQKSLACRAARQARADFVKTSTGFAPGGAVLADLVLMRTHSPDHVQVKAAGGVKTLDEVLAIRAVGTTRVGVSSTVAILAECKRRLAEAGE